MYSFNPPFWPFIAFRVKGWYWASLSNTRVTLPPSSLQLLWCQWNLLKCKGVNYLHVSPKHKETQAMSTYLGIHRIALFWIWTVSEDIFGWTYLYLYLNQCICICICIWINVEQNICICIWKIQIFVFVFVFVFDKTYLTPALLSHRYMLREHIKTYHWGCQYRPSMRLLRRVLFYV